MLPSTTWALGQPPPPRANEFKEEGMCACALECRCCCDSYSKTLTIRALFYAISQPVIEEILPKSGLLYSEKGNLAEVLCKPKIMAIKSLTLQKIEDMQKQATKGAQGSQGEAKR